MVGIVVPCGWINDVQIVSLQVSMWKCVRGVGNCCGRYIYWDVEIMVFLSAKRIFDSLSIKFGWSDLGKKVAEGGAWLSFGGSFEQVLRLVRNMVLSRVLLPNAFGSMALVLSIIAIRLLIKNSRN